MPEQSFFIALPTCGFWRAVRGDADRNHSYPLDRDYGDIYSGGVQVLRNSERTGYEFLPQVYFMDFVSVAALNRSKLEECDSELWITDQLGESTKRKMRTILRLVALNCNGRLVVSAFGYCAFKNPLQRIANLFHEVFEKDEFKDQFKTIAFAMLKDDNSHKEYNPSGNMAPFQREFGD